MFDDPDVKRGARAFFAILSGLTILGLLITKG